MRILAINSSPRVDGQSKTELMLNHLVKGMRNAGAEVGRFFYQQISGF
jgi:multimeric flavodoxin WrbA